ncbi:mitochondrial carrier domain-containing protein [Paraphysoderma sedebokerense]|nr:mitochondrial carrier domain-containing protein [Paraphysoderma sedebokerense]
MENDTKSETLQKPVQIKQKPSSIVHFVAGGFGGTVGAVVTCPLEVVKTRLQSSYYQSTILHRPPSNSSWIHNLKFHVADTLRILKDIHKSEGIRGLWRGIGPNLVGVVPARAIYFSSYNKAKQLYTELNNHNENSFVYLSSAATAGAVTAFTTNPIWLIKTRMQLQSNSPDIHLSTRYRNSLDCLVRVVREEGVAALYRGVTASLIGVSESTVQWVIYEKLKKVVDARRAERIQLVGVDNGRTFRDWFEYFSIAAAAKLFAATVTYPHEVIRTRMRQSPVAEPIYKYRSFVQSFRVILKEEGVMALYGGMTAHLLRVVPNAAIMFCCYEAVVYLAQR